MRCNFGSGVNQVSVTPEELIVTANVRTLRTVVAKNFVGDGGLLSNITVANAAIPGTIYADLFGNQTGTFMSLTGNATAKYFVGNGALLTGLVVGNSSLPKTIAADLSGNVRGGNATMYRLVVDQGVALPTEAVGSYPAYVEGPLLEHPLGLDPPGVRVRASSNQNVTGWATNAMFMAHAAPGVRRRCFQTVLGGNVTTGNTAGGDVTSYIDSYGGGYFGNAVTAASLSATGNVSASFFLGNGALLTGLVVGNSSLPKTIAADIVGNLTGNNVTLIGNASAAYFVGNGALLTGLVVGNSSLPKTIAADIVGNQAGTTMALTGNATASYFVGNGALLTGLVVGNSSLPKTIAADIVGNQTGTTMALTGNASMVGLNAARVVSSEAVFAGGSTTANSQGLFTTAIYNTQYVYSDTFVVGNLGNITAFWRKTDGLLTTPAATINGRLTVNGLGSELTGDQFYLKRTVGNPAPLWEQYSMSTQPISVVTAGGIYISGGNLWASSDARKKFDVEAASPAACAAAVRASRLVSYSTLETAGRQVGFIAQQVANVVPGSVTKAEQAVPSVMRLANVATPRSFVLEGASEALTGAHVVGVRLVRRSGSTLDANVASVVGDLVTLEDAALEGADVFVYGPVVDDFNTLDYQRMWGTAFGAVQHLLAESDETGARLAALERRLGAVERRGWRRAAARAVRGAARRLTACFRP